jgi:hypothetical protein
VKRPTTTIGGGGSAAYFQMLSRAQQCASVAKLSRAAMSTEAIAGLIGTLRAEVERMIAEHQATAKETQP